MRQHLLDDEEFKLSKGKRGEKSPVLKERLAKPSYLKQTKSKSPQAVIKVVTHGYGKSGKNMMEYIARADKNTELIKELEDENGAAITSKTEIDQVFKEWKQSFEKEAYGKGPAIREYNAWKALNPNLKQADFVKTKQIEVRAFDTWLKRNPSKSVKDYPEKSNTLNKFQDWRKKNPKKKVEEFKIHAPRVKRHVSHMILSADCKHTELNMRKVMQSARELMQEEYGQKGYRYVMTAHNDGKRPHVHVVMSTYNKDLDKAKLRIGPNELFKMRSKFADRLRDQGIKQVATKRMDRVETVQRILDGSERLKENEKHSRRMIRRGNPNTNEVKRKLIQEQSLSRITKQIKSVTMPFSKDRKKLMDGLKDSRETLRSDKPLSSKQIDTIVNSLGESKKQFDNEIKMLTKPELFQTKAVQRNKKAAEKLATHIEKKTTTEIKLARKEIMKADMSTPERKQALKQLRTYEREMTKAVAKHITRPNERTRGRGR